MPQEHFATFRRYLGAKPERGLEKGASAAFSANVPIIDILLGGRNLPQSFYDYLEENRRYLSRGAIDLDEATDIADSGLSLGTLYERLGQPKDLFIYLNLASSLMHEYRLAHYRAVSRQVPEALKDETPGTSGETSPGTFLRRRMEFKYGEFDDFVPTKENLMVI